ncbi:MAG: PIN domain-containing protein [Steroidobacteraceae bacterium]|jgi:predicted nucleic acid-binding protein
MTVVLDVVEPVHWLAELAAVLARLTPATAIDDVAMLAAMELPTLNEPLTMIRATALAIDTGTHLFDTLYHALALEHAEATLITADGRYCEKADVFGRIIELCDWTPTANRI